MTADAVSNVWLIIAGVTLATYGLRGSFLLTISQFDGLPPTVNRITPFVPPAVLAALIAPNLFLQSGALAFTIGNERLLAGTFAFGVAWYTENMLATVGAGMAALWILLWL